MTNVECYFSFSRVIPGLNFRESSISFSPNAGYKEIWAAADVGTALISYGYSDGIYKGVPKDLGDRFRGHGLPIVLPSGGIMWCGAIKDGMIPCVEIDRASRVSDQLVFGENSKQVLGALRRFRSFFSISGTAAMAKPEFRSRLNKSITYYYDRVDLDTSGPRTPVKVMLDSMFSGQITHYFEHPWDDNRRKASLREWLKPQSFLSSWRVATQAATQANMLDRFWWLGTYSPGLAVLVVRHLIPPSDFREVYAGLESLIPSDFGWDL